MVLTSQGDPETILDVVQRLHIIKNTFCHNMLNPKTAGSEKRDILTPVFVWRYAKRFYVHSMRRRCHLSRQARHGLQEFVLGRK